MSYVAYTFQSRAESSSSHRLRVEHEEQHAGQREKLYRLLAANPEIRDIVARALEVEEKENQYHLEWAWHEIPISTQKLRALVALNRAGSGPRWARNSPARPTPSSAGLLGRTPALLEISGFATPASVLCRSISSLRMPKKRTVTFPLTYHNA